MELLQLQYFQRVARMEHMTKAAKDLRIAQPALSKTIARLERDIGVPLFDRKGNLFHLLHIKQPICQRTYQLSWLKERYLSQAANTFRDFFLQSFIYR
ncbi:regulatory helix-turn-helix protein, lysR family [Seinonella peptonophila]|uniref:Regulatory helix-turn-helix protein, lysR family n=1 Tax=Seinonella peptonophila TaxID=112248 RepID=A0A1M5AKC3_9BACL|nr:regulatory helix-turn-helix protein, lysR family [Seinonella peptonophila]